MEPVFIFSGKENNLTLTEEAILNYSRDESVENDTRKL
jgi:hypothetical protein